MKYIFDFLVGLFFFFFLFKNYAEAVCPVCTIAVGAGVGLCRFLGIDDTISGVWIGGLVFSSGLWLGDFLQKKNIKLKYIEFLSIIFFFLVVLLSLYWMKLIGIEKNTFLGVDKLLFGMASGSIMFIFAVWTDKFLRKKNHGRVFIYYQKVILPVLYLTITSFIFYLITC